MAAGGSLAVAESWWRLAKVGLAGAGAGAWWRAGRKARIKEVGKQDRFCEAKGKAGLGGS